MFWYIRQSCAKIAKSHGENLLTTIEYIQESSLKDHLGYQWILRSLQKLQVLLLYPSITPGIFTLFFPQDPHRTEYLNNQQRTASLSALDRLFALPAIPEFRSYLSWLTPPCIAFQDGKWNLPKLYKNVWIKQVEDKYREWVENNNEFMLKVNKKKNFLIEIDELYTVNYESLQICR